MTIVKNESGNLPGKASGKGLFPLLWSSRTPPHLPEPAAHSLEVLKLYRGNSSRSAQRMIAAGYESLRRQLPQLSTPLPVVAWLYLRGRMPASGTPVNGSTWQLDRDGMLLHLRLPEDTWLPALLTMRMQVRMGISLPHGRGRLVATGVALWAESFQPFEPLKLGIAFTEISEQDRKRIRRLVGQERRMQEFREELRRHQQPSHDGAWAYGGYK